jgi:hypothetical protein
MNEKTKTIQQALPEVGQHFLLQFSKPFQHWKKKKQVLY